MRSISVSTDVFAEIWSLRLPGEDSEDAILRRVLFSKPGTNETALAKTGVRDTRNNVEFPPNFRVQRTYKRTFYEAVAANGSWALQNDGSLHGSLNQLSRAIGAGVENAWQNWFFNDGAGVLRPVSDFRSRQEVPRMLQQARQATTWREDTHQALVDLGGRAPLSKIYQTVRENRAKGGRTTPRNLEAVVRKELEINSSDSEVFHGGQDLFRMPEGKGAGIWALKDH